MKIREIINIKLEVVEEYDGCEGCYWLDKVKKFYECGKPARFECYAENRPDGKNVIFKEVKDEAS